MAKQMMVYAIKDGKGVYIDDVERGLKCGCICPSCGRRLVAKKGANNTDKKAKKAAHFAHENAECPHGYETSLHLMAKEILSKEKEFLLPPVRLPLQPPNWNDFSPAQSIDIEKVELEKHSDGMVPDLVLYPVSKAPSPKTLAIEIFVTHKTGEEKIKKFKSQKQAAIEIDISRVDQYISYKELKKLLLSDTKQKYWLNNEKANDYNDLLLRCSNKLPPDIRGCMDFCPQEIKNVPLYNKPEICRKCPYYINQELCTGKIQIKNCEELKRVKNIDGLTNDDLPIPTGFCPKCHKRLFPYNADGNLIMQCPKCKQIQHYDSETIANLIEQIL